ncbi:PIN domain-containing protein [Akkermansiaceae bacterium]|nr:PIN domain-containing protein [Akkermansiaceae bacterium]
MASFSLDTSFVLRILTESPDSQLPAALSFYEEQRQDGSQLFISDLVLSECYFALQFHFGFTKADALAALKALTAQAPVAITPSARKVFGLPNLSQTKPGFIDRLIHGAAHGDGQTLVTFEKAAKKLPNTLVLVST